MYDVIIIGMGASGLFAAANLDSSIKALCLEGNKKPGRKLLITGGGRCNLTNTDDVKTLVSRYTHPSFIRPIIYGFNNSAVIEWFEDKGLSLKNENGRIYPADERAGSVLNCLLSEIKRKKHEIRFEQRAIKLDLSEENILVITDKAEYKAKKIIIATGGASYPETGSDGEFLKNNFKIIKFSPAMCPLYVKEKLFDSLLGVSLGKVRAVHNKKEYLGTLLFTGKSLSGTAIFNLSNYISEGDSFNIDFMPSVSNDELYAIVRKEISLNPKKQFKNIIVDKLKAYDLPESFVKCIVSEFDFSALQCSNISISNIKDLIFAIKFRGFNLLRKENIKRATVTKGGISCESIDNKDMSLKHDSRIIVIGEAIETVGYCGGYSLQLAFSTAMRAVKNLSF